MWQAFPGGTVKEGKGGNATLRLATEPVSVQWVRILMTASSNTCDSHGSADTRNCVGYAIRELYLGTTTADGKFHDLIRHTADQDQTATYCSSVDPWHEARDLDEKAGEQVGFDRFFTSGITRGLPAMIPIAMLYSTPEDAVAELKYLGTRGFRVFAGVRKVADGEALRQKGSERLTPLIMDVTDPASLHAAAGSIDRAEPRTACRPDKIAAAGARSRRPLAGGRLPKCMMLNVGTAGHRP